MLHDDDMKKGIGDFPGYVGLPEDILLWFMVVSNQ